MTLNTEKFIRKVRPVEAVRVTEENLQEVAAWCGGLVVPINGLGQNNSAPYVHVPVRTPRKESDSQAQIGEWVVRMDFRNHQVFPHKTFKNSYENFGAPSKQQPVKTAAVASAINAMAPKPTQVGAVEVVPGTPPVAGNKPLTTGTIPVNPATEVVVDATPEEIAAMDTNSFNHDAMTTGEVVPGDMRDIQQAEVDPDGTVQLGAPVELATELCADCGSPVNTDGLCTNNPEHVVSV